MSNKTDLCFMSIAQLTNLFAKKAVSPVEVCTAVLARIEAENPTYNAICFVDHEGALDSARASEARWRRDIPLGPLDGIPTTIKDLVLTKGWPTLRGSRTVDPKGPWDEDAPSVDKLRAAGAVLVGKTTTPEFGSKGVTDNILTGITRNAWNPDRTSGGSSGGAAVAAARGFGVLHLGSDGAGSVRIPAAFNGIFGLKPTFGRVPAYPLSPMGTVSHLGPMTRTVADAAHMLNVMVKPDDRDWYALPPQNIDYHEELDTPLSGLRIAYSKDLGYAEVDPKVAEVCAAAARRFEELGAQVDDIEGPLTEDPVWITDVLWFNAITKITENMSAQTIKSMDTLQQAMLEHAQSVSVKDLRDANSARETMALRLTQVHRNYDLLLSPAMPRTAFAAGQFNPWGSEKPQDWIRWSSFTYPFNLSQQPAATCPCGFDDDGLPIGLQIVGRKYDDHLVLRAAKAFEDIAKISTVVP
ncbi:MAG: amidase [Magnetovibrio sp.]|nr:amidase [Magnetovibrio sp.]